MNSKGRWILSIVCAVFIIAIVIGIFILWITFPDIFNIVILGIIAIVITAMVTLGIKYAIIDPLFGDKKDE